MKAQRVISYMSFPIFEKGKNNYLMTKTSTIYYIFASIWHPGTTMRRSTLMLPTRWSRIWRQQCSSRPLWERSSPRAIRLMRWLSLTTLPTQTLWTGVCPKTRWEAERKSPLKMYSVFSTEEFSIYHQMIGCSPLRLSVFSVVLRLIFDWWTSFSKNISLFNP